jgi:hypothetical protein
VTSLQLTAARLGRLRWVELRLFEIMGGWVASTPEVAAKSALAEQCYHHAWHAELWAARFPQGYGHDLQEATQAGSEALSGWFDDLAALPTTLDRLAALYRVVVPRLALAYRDWEAKANPVADGPLLRWLRFASTDEATDWQSGECLLHDLLVNSDRVERAAAAQVRMEASLVAHGGILAGVGGPEQ